MTDKNKPRNEWNQAKGLWEDPNIDTSDESSTNELELNDNELEEVSGGINSQFVTPDSFAGTSGTGKTISSFSLTDEADSLFGKRNRPI